ncbi:MAG: sulfite exporter TauE/SafE family protein [Halopenitus sp.]
MDGVLQVSPTTVNGVLQAPPALFDLVGVDVALFLLIGLLGGAHCIGMCGPLVTMYAGRMNPETDGGSAAKATTTGSDTGGHAGDSRRGHLSTYEVRQHLLFNVGRATSYATIGALVGALGGAFYVGTDRLVATAGLVRGVVGVLIGLAVVAVGVKYLLGGSTGGVHLPGLDRVAGWLTNHVDRLASGPGILVLGGVHGLLPCPILYPAYLYAFATGSALSGAVALGALGLGTIPAVFAYGTLIESVDATHRRRLHRLLGVVFVVLGYVLLAHGLMSLGIHVPHPMFPFYDPLTAGGGV